jgi:hypothetical protein
VGEFPGRWWWWRELKEAKVPMLAKMHKKDAENTRFPALYCFKIAENAVFRSKVLDKIYYQDLF